MYTAKNKNTKPGNNPNAYQEVNEQTNYGKSIQCNTTWQ